MIYDQPSTLSSYITHLLSLGRVIFTAQEAEPALGIDHGAFLDAAEMADRFVVLGVVGFAVGGSYPKISDN